MIKEGKSESSGKISEGKTMAARVEQGVWVPAICESKCADGPCFAANLCINNIDRKKLEEFEKIFTNINVKV